MRIALAADHAGFALKAELAAWLREAGHDVATSARTARKASIIPNLAPSWRDAIASGEAERGIAVCGSGIGISIAVNRNPKCRCARVDDPLSARLAREHNDANVLALGGAADRRRHGARLRHRFPRHRLRRRAPPAPRRRAFHPPSGFRLMATVAAPPLSDVQPDGFFTRTLADADPAVAKGIAAELTREQTQIELIASENIVLARGARGAGLGADQQICRRLSGAALLSGLRTVGHGRESGDRAGQEAVQLRLRQRPAAQRARRPMAR